MLQSMYNQLYKNPVIGFISGLLSTVLLQVRSFLTDEQLLKEVAGLGVWMATIVGVLSGIIYSIKVYDILKIRINRWKEKRAAKVLPVILLFVLILGVSCKSRQVNLQKTTTHDITSTATITDSSKQSIAVTELSSAFKDSVARVDSFDVEILTDTGVISVGAGVFTGKAKAVKMRGRSQQTANRSGSSLQKDSTQVNEQSRKAETASQDKSTASKSKDIISKPADIWPLWIIGILVIIFAALYLAKFVKRISPTGIPKMQSLPPPPGINQVGGYQPTEPIESAPPFGDSFLKTRVDRPTSPDPEPKNF